VLIYLQAELQSDLVPLFHYAVKPGGHLFLGPSEGLSAYPELFEIVNPHHRIFRRRDTATRPAMKLPLSRRGRAGQPSEVLLPAGPMEGNSTSSPRREDISAAFERMALEEYTAPAVVVNTRGEIQLVAGRIGRFFQPPAGTMTTNLVETAPASLRVELKLALHQAGRDHRKVVREKLPVELDDGFHMVRLTVRPLPGLGQDSGLLAVIVQDHGLQEDTEEAEGSPQAVRDPVLESLENELRVTQAQLKDTVENLESTNEELKSSNEELVSTNEELQSTNEELQASEQELQSLNEELETVNNELQRRVEELATANSDLQNLFASTDIATTFLDRELRIVKFTPAARDLFHLVDSDVGRPIADFASRFDAQDLVGDAQGVLGTLAPVVKQVRTTEGKRWFILRVLPYRTIHHEIAGVVVTFVDVSELKRAEAERLKLAEQRQLALDAARLGWWHYDPATRVAVYDRRYTEIFGVSGYERPNEEILKLLHPEDVPRVWAAVERALDPVDPKPYQVQYRVNRPDGVMRWVEAHGIALFENEGAARRAASFVGTVADITERVRTQEGLSRLAAIVESTDDAILSKDLHGTILSWNPGAQRLLGYSAEEAIGRLVTIIIPPERTEEEDRILARIIAGEQVAPYETERLTKDGSRRAVSLTVSPLRDGNGNVIGASKILRDITERKRAETALRESEERFRTMSNAIPQLAWVAQADGFIYWYNDRWYQYTGTTPEQMEGWGWQSVHDPDALPRVLERWKASLESGEPFSMEFPLRGADGRFRRFLTRVLPLKDSRGRILRWFGTNTDVTEISETREALEKSEAKYRNLFENMAEEVHFWQLVRDERGRIKTWRLVDVNPPALKTWGRASVAEIQGKTTDEIFGPGATAHFMPVVEKIMSEGVPYSFEDYFPNLDKHFRFTSVPLGEHFITTGADITAIKRSQQEAMRSREGLRRLADASLSVIRRTALDEMLQAIAEAALALTGSRLATCGHGLVAGRLMVGGSARAPGAPACPPGNMFELARGGVHMALADGAASVRLTDEQMRAHPKWWGLPKDHVAMRGLLGVRMVARSGQTSGMILVSDKFEGDFTEEDESLLTQLGTVASLALQHVETRISLEESDRRKNDFLAILSHELRNPLAPIRNGLFILDRAHPGGEQAKRAKSVINRQVVHLTRLVDDLLDVTRISRGKIQLQRERVDLCEIARRATEDYRDAFARSNLDLEYVIPKEPLWVNADGTRLAQVIGNLLNNSAKFTQPGGKAVISLGANEHLRQAILRVSDSGIGIAADMLPRVFEAFAQADTTLDRSKGGLGLGLALVKGIVEMHGGTVSVESPGLERGAEFTVRLPIVEAALQEETPPISSSATHSAKRVLVVEDNVDGADSLREVLQLNGHVVEVAYSGTDAIEKARSFKPEVILCDIGLPGVDGFEVARAMRRDPALRDTMLIAVTGYATEEDIAKTTAAGFDLHIAKPPSVEKLQSALKRAGSSCSLDLGHDGGLRV